MFKDAVNEHLQDARTVLLFYRRCLQAVPLLLEPLYALFVGAFPHSLNRLAHRGILTVPSFGHDEPSSNLSSQGRQAKLLQTLQFF